MNYENDPRVVTALEHSGWTSLLPADRRGTVLCLEPGDGHATLALATLYERVLSVPLDAAKTEYLCELVNAAQAQHVEVFPTIVAALAAGPTAGLVAFLLRGLGPAQRGIRERLAKAIDGLPTDAFVFVVAANMLAYNRFLRHADHTGLEVPGGRGVARLVRRGGRVNTRVFPLLHHRGQPYEVLHGPYHSVSQGIRRTERDKELLLGQVGRRWLAHGYAALATRSATPTLLLDHLNACVDERCGGVSSVQRQLTLPDKTVITTETDDGSGRVIVLPRTTLSRERRTHEAVVLRQAQKLPDRLRQYFPRILGTGEADGRSWIALEKFQGMFLDDVVADHDLLTDRAVQLLLELHVNTREDRFVDLALYEQTAGTLLQAARDRHPVGAELLAKIDVRLRQTLEGHRLPFVWMHGDFKIENVAIDRKSRQPVGIIDWELSQPLGFPLLDLHYLLAYNRMIRTGHGFAATYAAIIDEGWSVREEGLLRAYCARLDLDAGQRFALRALFAVHAIGVRLSYDLSDAVERECLMGLLHKTLESIEPPELRETGGAA